MTLSIFTAISLVPHIVPLHSRCSIKTSNSSVLRYHIPSLSKKDVIICSFFWFVVLIWSQFMTVTVQVYWPWSLFLSFSGYVSLTEPLLTTKILDVLLKAIIFEIVEIIIAEIDRESSYTIRIPKGGIQACILFKTWRILIFNRVEPLPMLHTNNVFSDKLVSVCFVNYLVLWEDWREAALTSGTN